MFAGDGLTIVVVEMNSKASLKISENDSLSTDIKAAFELIHCLASGGEILSMFSKQEIEDLISHLELRKRFLGFNNHILYHILSKRVCSHLKMIITAEFVASSSNDSLEHILYSIYPNLFKAFNKYFMQPVLQSDDSEDSERKKWLSDLLEITIPCS